MAGNALRKRDNWQTESGPGGLAGSAEKDLIAALNANLDYPLMRSMIIQQI